LNQDNKALPTELSIEFYFEGKHFQYGIDVFENKIKEEKLSIIEKRQECVLFHRKMLIVKNKPTGKYSIEMPENSSDENQLMDLISNNLLLENELLIAVINKYGQGKFETIIDGYNWLTTKCVFINVESKVLGLVAAFENHPDLEKFINDKICNYGTGIESIVVDKIPLAEYLGKNESYLLEKIKNDLDVFAREIPIQEYKDEVREPIVFVKIGNAYFAKVMLFQHFGLGENTRFRFDEESDGTKRLLELIPMFYFLQSDITFVVDEIERSLHPKLIKDLITTFSRNDSNKGQIVFTTHETQLLDQEIIRPDEIWLVEKDENGATKMEPMSNYDVHPTKNIQNGYLQGRYGGIPFLTA
jgi:AAA15 family ATPase/GTPase